MRNLLFYDRQTNSLWSQLGDVAVAGPLAGETLKLLPSTETTWTEWQQKHPGTHVLSFNTGYKRDYSHDPYRKFPLDRRLALVVRIGEAAKIYPFSELAKQDFAFIDVIVGKAVRIQFEKKSRTARVRLVNGDRVSHFISFLPDARAFYPLAPIFKRK